MQLKLVKYPDARLKKICEPITEVTQKHRQIASSMHYYMRYWKGVGLSANQVGKFIRLIVVNTGIDGHILTMFNPEIVETEAETSYTEGCLSFPRQYRTLKRPAVIKVKYLDRDNVQQEGVYTGLAARAIIHEIDHLNGVVFVDHPEVVSEQAAV